MSKCKMFMLLFM